MNPEKFFAWVKEKIGKESFLTFVATFVIGLFTHMPALVSDIPNHDGLASMYFDQNMITSGRWFLQVACGISSYFSLPWLIGILALIYLAVGASLLCRLLKIKSTVCSVLIGGMMVTFPVLASNFAYVFTMDGYMLGLFLAILAVYLVGNAKYGFLWGGISLAFSMGIYQSYLPVTILLSVYMAVTVLAGTDAVKNRIKGILRYVYMGVIGVALYYALLRLLLMVQGKTLADYQGINTMADASGMNLLGTLKAMYFDFIAFTLKGNVLANNPFAKAAFVILVCLFLMYIAICCIRKKWYKNVAFYIVTLIVAATVPIFTNIILLISESVNYHALMRYQWVLFAVVPIAVLFSGFETNENKNKKIASVVQWVVFICGVVVVFSNVVTDNIAYSNLQKKYEKTYAYCLRLADRIEQTEGYYTGIPIYMIGVVGDDNYPVTDITAKATDHLIGIGGDYLLYTGENYELFFEHYMGISFNFLRPEEANYYNEDFYAEMPSFPAEGSAKVVNGIMFVKTENYNRD